VTCTSKIEIKGFCKIGDVLEIITKNSPKHLSYDLSWCKVIIVSKDGIRKAISVNDVVINYPKIEGLFAARMAFSRLSISRYNYYYLQEGETKWLYSGGETLEECRSRMFEAILENFGEIKSGYLLCTNR